MLSTTPLTKRQREILSYVTVFIADNGYAPSMKEIGQRFGLTSLATVSKHLENLQRKGRITRSWGRSRAITVQSGCPTCGRPISENNSETCKER